MGKKNILILANNSNGLFIFRGMLIEKLLTEYNVICSTPRNIRYDDLADMGCKMEETLLDRRGMNPFTDLKLLLFYLRLIKKYEPSLVITYTIKPNIYGALACRLYGASCASNITGLGTAFQNKGILCTLVSCMYKTAFKKVKVVFFENIENRDILVNKGIVKKSKAVLLNGAGVDLGRFKLLDYPQSGTDTNFLFVGRVMKEKGVDELFTATKQLIDEGQNVHLHIVGNYEENYRQTIETHVKEGWLTYHGVQADVRPFIAQTHCFVLPSWHEGMANTNLECAASGRPVITSNIHGCLEAVEDGVSGYLVEKKNPEDLYRAMKKFSGLSYEERKEMGLAGRKRMEKLFDKKIVVEKTISKL